MRQTKEGGTAHEHELDHCLSFFSKAGSLFENRSSFYTEDKSALSLFQKCWIVDKETALKLLLWLRDCRGGAGNRSGFRSIANWLADMDGEWLAVNMDWIPEVGRWDDLRSLFGTALENKAALFWAEAIRDNQVLAAKWADRKDKPVKHALGIKEEGKFRKLLARIRKNHIVEHKMSTRRWNEIDYHTVPSLAMARYTNAFMRHDENRFTKYKEQLKTGESTIHADVLFPHDCIRTVRNGDAEIAEAQFNALPNYLEGTNEKIVVISDTSGSMTIHVSGSIKAVDVSQGMALYCSAKIPEDNPFHKKFIGFCDEGRFKNWNGMSFSQAVNDHNIFDGAIGPTQIDRALKLILETASFFGISDDYMPTTLLIVSDMQFHVQTRRMGMRGKPISTTEVNEVLDEFEQKGYSRPKIVYWNTAGYAGSPETALGNNVSLVSGFSPAVLKAIFSGEDMSPIGVMKKAIEKYEINTPKEM